MQYHLLAAVGVALSQVFFWENQSGKVPGDKNELLIGKINQELFIYKRRSEFVVRKFQICKTHSAFDLPKMMARALSMLPCHCCLS